MADPLIKQLDLVELLTVKNVSYLSAKPGHAPSTHGKWTVVGILAGNDILLSKEEALIRIPLTDIRKVESYDIHKVIENLKKVNNGKKIRQKTTKSQAEDIRRHFEV